jgi:hypothetical protein
VQRASLIRLLLRHGRANHEAAPAHLPFCRRLDLEYPSGIRHIIFNCATPISDGQIYVVQLLFRNNTEADCSARELIDWGAAIIAEDRDMLESTDPDAIVDMGRKIEMHMPSDRPRMIKRKRLLELLTSTTRKTAKTPGRLRPTGEPGY